VISRHIRALFLRRPVALSRTESDRSVLFYLERWSRLRGLRRDTGIHFRCSPL
jgi:hypothetical protein